MQPLALGIGYSIYFFLILVFSVMGAIAFYVVRMIRREERAMRESGNERKKARGSESARRRSLKPAGRAGSPNGEM